MLKGINIYFCSGILNINLTQYVVFKRKTLFCSVPGSERIYSQRARSYRNSPFLDPPLLCIYTRIHAAYFILEFFISETKLNVCFLQLLDLQ